MSRPYPNRRKKRPGRRPPHRYRGGGFQVRPNSFQDFGARHIYDLILPDIRGRDRRRFFNGFSRWFTIAMGLSAARWGGEVAGPVGAFFGFGGGFMLGDHLARKHGFYRP